MDNYISFAAILNSIQITETDLRKSEKNVAEIGYLPPSISNGGNSQPKFNRLKPGINKSWRILTSTTVPSTKYKGNESNKLQSSKPKVNNEKSTNFGSKNIQPTLFQLENKIKGIDTNRLINIIQKLAKCNTNIISKYSITIDGKLKCSICSSNLDISAQIGPSNVERYLQGE